jgi:hypothetical protein
MAPDERSRVEASQALTDQLGPAAAAALMECIPPFGWNEIATKNDLAKLEQLLVLQIDASLQREMGRMIRWTVGSVFGGITAVCAAAVGIAALIS